MKQVNVPVNCTSVLQVLLFNRVKVKKFPGLLKCVCLRCTQTLGLKVKCKGRSRFHCSQVKTSHQ